MKLYSYWRSSSAWRVRIVLEYKGIDYSLEPVNLAPGVSAQGDPGFDAIYPMRQVPTLEWLSDERVVRLAQSVAIAEYLEERFPSPALLPEAPLARALVRQAVEIVNSGTQPHQNTGTLAVVTRLAGAEAARDFARDAIGKGLEALEALAKTHGGDFVVGNAPTLADVYLVPQMYNARRFEVDLAPFPRLVAIDAHASALAPFQRAHPDQQPDAPPSAPPKRKEPP